MINKGKIFMLFLLGIIAGIITSQAYNKRENISKPFFSTDTLNITGLIQTISNEIRSTETVFTTSKTNTDFSRFEEINKILQTQYYDKELIDLDSMLQNAIKAYVDGLNDPYTVYLDAEQYSGFETSLKGEQDFEGIGAVITKKDYYVMIEEIIKESPAFRAGLMPLDRIISINDESTKELTISEAVSKIRGPKDTIVTLTIERIKNEEKEIIKIDVTRDKLSIPSVSSVVRTGTQGEKIGHITISLIGEETEKLLKKNINDLRTENIQGIILDLRGNGGGLLPIAVEIASHFIPKGKNIVTAKYTSYGDEVFTSKGYADLQDYPTVVLIDEMTASAGEIIALALKEQNNATLIGQKTFGKGSIQTLEEFRDGASLKYTIGKRYSPSGINIDREGVHPDIIVVFDTDAYVENRTDAQLEKAIEIVTQKIQEK